jgi:hypothetical protein
MKYMAKRILPVSCGLLVALAIAAGCAKKAPTTIDPNRAAVTGTVTLDGVPLPGGEVNLVSVTDPKCRTICAIKSGGVFSKDNAPRGDVLVSVNTETEKFSNPKRYVAIPSKYADVKTSGLTATIGKDEPLTFDLKSK